MASNFEDGRFGNKVRDFDAPTKLPRSETERQQWQETSKAWWEATPMRYDWRNRLEQVPNTKGYFEEIDRRFLSSARKYVPWRELPFDTLIPYDALANKDVLEIGVGQGTHAQLIAPHCRSFTGIDLTSRAAEATATRLELVGIRGRVLQMDAERMDFASNSFDYVWSWGVIHHSADTRGILREMHRVLRSGGECTVMVYHRSWWYFYVCGYLRRLFQNRLGMRGGLHRVTQNATDGAIARFYTEREWRELVSDFFQIREIGIFGLKAEILPLPHGRLKDVLEAGIPDTLGRLLTNRLRMGSFLVATMRKV